MATYSAFHRPHRPFVVRGVSPVLHAAGDYAESRCDESGKMVNIGLTKKGKRESPCAQRCMEYHEVVHVKDADLNAACAAWRSAQKTYEEVKKGVLKGKSGPYPNARDRKDAEADAEAAIKRANREYAKAKGEAECVAWLATLKCFKKMECYYDQPGNEEEKKEDCPDAKRWVSDAKDKASRYCDKKQAREKAREAPD